MPKSLKIAVAGAGIYGSTIATSLARQGHRVTLFDPLGVMRAASVINQFRVHSGYHYPRSAETMAEILEVKDEFLREFREAIVHGSRHYYAIPHQGSKVSPAEYEAVLRRFSLPFQNVRPRWMNFDFINACYRVDEKVYDPRLLRSIVVRRLKASGVPFVCERFFSKDERLYDRVVYATYGTCGNHVRLFDRVQLQVAEKILIQLPRELRKISLVVVDGPFTAFDSYGNSRFSLFGSALHTNHWKMFKPEKPVPERYRKILNARIFETVRFTHFSKMREEAQRAVPLASRAKYLGSRFTLRLVEYNPSEDRRILRIGQAGKEISVFSGKVVSAVKAARIVCEMVAADA